MIGNNTSSDHQHSFLIHHLVATFTYTTFDKVGVRILEWAHGKFQNAFLSGTQSGCSYSGCAYLRELSLDWGSHSSYRNVLLSGGPTARQRVSLVMGARVRSSDGQAAGSATTVEEA